MIGGAGGVGGGGEGGGGEGGDGGGGEGDVGEGGDGGGGEGDGGEGGDSLQTAASSSTRLFVSSSIPCTRSDLVGSVAIRTSVAQLT